MGLTMQGAVLYEEPGLVLGFTQAAFFAFDQNFGGIGEAGVTINADGTVDIFEANEGGARSAGRWYTGGPINVADYDFQAAYLSGVAMTTPNADDTWVNGASMPIEFNIQAGPFQNRNWNGGLFMRRASDQVVIDSKPLVITVDTGLN